MSTAQPYPRPDFQRSELKWESLNGPWDFLFDDDNVGLVQEWSKFGLPNSFSVAVPKDDASQHHSAGNDSILQKVASGTQEFLQNNTLIASSSSRVNKKQEITVPFVFQCPASGINERGVHEVFWYERTIQDPRSAEDKKLERRVLLRFGAIDYEATIFVDDHYFGIHTGGHVPIELDITHALDAVDVDGKGDGLMSHRITIRVFDSAHDLTQPRGKQYWGAKPESIFYTPSGGIWQNVWLEVVPLSRIGDSSYGTVLKSNDILGGKLTGTIAVAGYAKGQNLSVEVESSFAGGVIARFGPKALGVGGNKVEFAVNMRLTEEQRTKVSHDELTGTDLSDDNIWRDGVALWSPEYPQLYDITLRVLSSSGKVLDEVHTTAGMRSIDWTGDDGYWRLNGKPYFQALCLDQGYWPDTFMTPPSQESLKTDIEIAKRMGLNGCRKHQKVEDPAFYYWADRLGYLVWAEMANAYQFSHEYVRKFNREWAMSVMLAINHPSVVTWTPVNETWGYPELKDNIEQQDHIRSLYFMTKRLDDTRPVNDNCGWQHLLTDLTTFHDYAPGPELARNCSTLETILKEKPGGDMFIGAKLDEATNGVNPYPNIISFDDPTMFDPLRIVGSDEGDGPRNAHRPGAPIICTEFGGVNIASLKEGIQEGDDIIKDGVDGEVESDRRQNWGYTTASNSEDLLKRVESLIYGVTHSGLISGFVYTQLTDIEQEANGLYTFDRKEKLDCARVKALVEEAKRVYYEKAR